MTRPSTGTSHIGRSLNVAAIGGGLFCAALVTGLAELIPAGVAAGLGGGGLYCGSWECEGSFKQGA